MRKKENFPNKFEMKTNGTGKWTSFECFAKPTEFYFLFQFQVLHIKLKALSFFFQGVNKVRQFSISKICPRSQLPMKETDSTNDFNSWLLLSFSFFFFSNNSFFSVLRGIWWYEEKIKLDFFGTLGGQLQRAENIYYHTCWRKINLNLLYLN